MQGAWYLILAEPKEDYNWRNTISPGLAIPDDEKDADGE